MPLPLFATQIGLLIPGGTQQLTSSPCGLVKFLKWQQPIIIKDIKSIPAKAEQIHIAMNKPKHVLNEEKESKVQHQKSPHFEQKLGLQQQVVPQEQHQQVYINEAEEHEEQLISQSLELTTITITMTIMVSRIIELKVPQKGLYCQMLVGASCNIYQNYYQLGS